MTTDIRVAIERESNGTSMHIETLSLARTRRERLFWRWAPQGLISSLLGTGPLLDLAEQVLSYVKGDEMGSYPEGGKPLSNPQWNFHVLKQSTSECQRLVNKQRGTAAFFMHSLWHKAFCDACSPPFHSPPPPL